MVKGAPPSRDLISDLLNTPGPYLKIFFFTHAGLHILYMWLFLFALKIDEFLRELTPSM